jgi:hypothetical protein
MNTLISILFYLLGFNPWQPATEPPPFIMNTRWGMVTDNVIMSNGRETIIGYYRKGPQWEGWEVAETEEPVTEGQRPDVVRWKYIPY